MVHYDLNLSGSLLASSGCVTPYRGQGWLRARPAVV